MLVRSKGLGEQETLFAMASSSQEKQHEMEDVVNPDNVSEEFDHGPKIKKHVVTSSDLSNTKITEDILKPSDDYTYIRRAKAEKRTAELESATIEGSIQKKRGRPRGSKNTKQRKPQMLLDMSSFAPGEKLSLETAKEPIVAYGGKRNDPVAEYKDGKSGRSGIETTSQIQTETQGTENDDSNDPFHHDWAYWDQSSGKKADI